MAMRQAMTIRMLPNLPRTTEATAGGTRPADRKRRISHCSLNRWHPGVTANQTSVQDSRMVCEQSKQTVLHIGALVIKICCNSQSKVTAKHSAHPWQAQGKQVHAVHVYSYSLHLLVR